MGEGSDLALAFEQPKNSGKYRLWFGRVIQMFSPVSGKLRRLDWPEVV